MAKKKEKPEVEKQPLPWERPNGNYMGKHYGFNVEDGKVQLAPCLADPFKAINNERMAIQEYIDAQNKYLERRFREIATRQREWWDRVSEELGLDRKNHSCTYDGTDLRHIPKAEEQPK